MELSRELLPMSTPISSPGYSPVWEIITEKNLNKKHDCTGGTTELEVCTI
jgi:hypothetical protein